MEHLLNFMKFVGRRSPSWGGTWSVIPREPGPVKTPPEVPVEAPVKITRPPGKVIQFPRSFNEAASHFDRAAFKGYLKAAFTGAAMNTAAKLALSTAIRSTDVTMGGASALAGGVRSIWDDVKWSDIKDDYHRALTNALPGHTPLTKMQAAKIIAAQTFIKHRKKFALGAASGFAGAWGADLLLDHLDVGEKLKEFAQPLRDFTTGIGAWFSERYNDLKEKCIDLKNYLFPGPPANELTLPGEKISPLPSIGLPSAAESLELPEHTPAPPVSEIIDNQPTPEIVQETTEELPQAELTPQQQLAALLDISMPGTPQDDTIYAAIKGKSWAQNDLIDGLYNGRFGFEENRELAAALTAEWSAPIREQLAARGADSLSEGQKRTLLNFAFMEHNSGNAQDALGIVKQLGRSWPGAPELAEQFSSVTEASLEPENTEILADTKPAPEIAVGTPETISCHAQQNPPGIEERYDVACDPFESKLKPGDTINLDVNFNNGAKDMYTLDVGPSAAGTSNEKYLENALYSVLREVQPPETTPILTASQ